jgi:hypothetical protein
MLKKDNLDNELQNPHSLVSIHSLSLLLSLPFLFFLSLLLFAAAPLQKNKRKKENGNVVFLSSPERKSKQI